jgi:chaperonin GroES
MAKAKKSAAKKPMKAKKSTAVVKKKAAPVKTQTKTKTKTKIQSRAKPQPKAKPAAASLGKKKPSTLSHLISPLDDRVLVQVEEGEKITAGGIIIPDTSMISGNSQAVVVAVGRGHRDSKGRIRPLDLKIGDRVLLPEHAGDSIEILNSQVKILRESEILGIVQK